MASYGTATSDLGHYSTWPNPYGGSFNYLSGNFSFGGTGYTTTVPYSIDVGALYQNQISSIGTFPDGTANFAPKLAHVSHMSFRVWGIYDNGAGTMYRISKVWHQYNIFATTPFAPAGAVLLQSYQSSTTWAVGAVNAGAIRATVSGNTLLLQIYGVAAPTAASVIRAGYAIDFVKAHF